jgi:flagellar hook-length control protein FliK
MTSAITRAPAGAAHAQGFAKSLKGDAPAQAMGAPFEALFAAVAGAQTQPAMPVAGDAAGKGAERKGKPDTGANDDDKASPQALLIAASMTLVTPSDAKVVDPRAIPSPANAGAVAAKDAAAAPPPLEIGAADSTQPAPASQRIVPNAAFVITQPAAHALIAHKGHVAESTVAPTADPPRITRAPVVPETAASTARREPETGAPVPNHAEAEPVSPAPPSSPPTQAPAERTRSALSPRALVQAVMVEVVRSPGRGRMPSPDAANADSTQPQLDAAASSKSPIAAATAAISAASPEPVSGAPVQMPPIVEQAVVADAAPAIAQPGVATKPAPASRAAADIARQRQFVLASAETLAASDPTETSMPAFDALIALRKADGTLDSRAQAAPNAESISPGTPSGAWLGSLPASTTQALNATANAAMPRTFDQAAWSAALAQQVTASAVAATRETTVRIKPDGLGPIEVRVRVEAQHVDVRFAIEHPVTVNMVREALPDLQRMLAQSGLNLGDAQVAQQNAGNRGQAARSDASASQGNDDEPAAPIGSAIESRPRARVGLLDDFV